MKAQSKKQQMAAEIALSTKRGKKNKAELKGSSRKMHESMSEEELHEIAKTRSKNIPTKK